ncbi:MAG: hypothetical protein WDM91_04235 [Rhizomicrobium sp.]
MTERPGFTIYRDAFGHWCARRADGLVGGTFREREAALRFVRHESRGAMMPAIIDRDPLRW